MINGIWSLFPLHLEVLTPFKKSLAIEEIWELKKFKIMIKDVDGP